MVSFLLAILNLNYVDNTFAYIINYMNEKNIFVQCETMLNWFPYLNTERYLETVLFPLNYVKNP